MKAQVARCGTILVALVSIAGAVPVQASEQLPAAYVMTVYENVSYGQAILGKPSETTISRLARKQHKDRLSNQTNLCVAYVKTKQISKAAEACDSAISASESEARRLRRTEPFGRRSGRIADTGRAIALTNRGVVHALVGETDQARTMFEKAMQLDSTEDSAAGNLARLDLRTAARDY